jgi:hypothetical protein
MTRALPTAPFDRPIPRPRAARWLAAATGLAGLLVACGPAAEPEDAIPPAAAENASSVPGNDLEAPNLDRAAPEEVRRARLPLVDRAIRKRFPEALATVTFVEPLAPEETIQLLRRYDVRPQRAILLTHADDDTLITGLVALDEAEPATLADVLETGAADTSRRGGRPLGVSAFVGHVPGERLRPLQADPRVYLVDLSADPALGARHDGDESAHDLGWRLWQERHGPARGAADGDAKNGSID